MKEDVPGSNVEANLADGGWSFGGLSSLDSDEQITVASNSLDGVEQISHPR